MTDFGYKYFMYFATFHLTSTDNEELLIPNFGFNCSPKLIRKKGQKHYDPKVSTTIKNFLLEFFIRNPHLPVLYLCDTEEDLAENRHRTFKKWGQEISKTIPISIHECGQAYFEAGFFSSILVRTDFEEKEKYVGAFYHSLKEFFPDIG
ncbi:hypothetical protein LX64_04423 [Chitinophaga skermanii]|uniref:Uncharacterized protein n=2 Tax=Chitinophaga skermanii TaxID=331697 RepID=A0A327Q616_9BACT|nr:hypothetical protein LX64_04423 [Chitinophaga skermanii]